LAIPTVAERIKTTNNQRPSAKLLLWFYIYAGLTKQYQYDTHKHS